MSRRTIALLVAVFVLLLVLNVGVIYSISSGKIQLGAVAQRGRVPCDPTRIRWLGMSANQNMTPTTTLISVNAERWVGAQIHNNCNYTVTGVNVWIGISGVRGPGIDAQTSTIDRVSYKRIYQGRSYIRGGATWYITSTQVGKIGPITAVEDNPKIIIVAYSGNNVPTSTLNVSSRILPLVKESQYFSWVDRDGNSTSPSMIKEDGANRQPENDPLENLVAVGNVLTYNLGVKNTSTAPKDVRLQLSSEGIYGSVISFTRNSGPTTVNIPTGSVFPITSSFRLAAGEILHLTLKIQVSGLTNYAPTGQTSEGSSTTQTRNASFKAEVFEVPGERTSVLSAVNAMPIAEWQ